MKFFIRDWSESASIMLSSIDGFKSVLNLKWRGRWILSHFSRNIRKIKWRRIELFTFGEMKVMKTATLSLFRAFHKLWFNNQAYDKSEIYAHRSPGMASRTWRRGRIWILNLCTRDESLRRVEMRGELMWCLLRVYLKLESNVHRKPRRSWKICRFNEVKWRGSREQRKRWFLSFISLCEHQH